MTDFVLMFAFVWVMALTYMMLRPFFRKLKKNRLLTPFYKLVIFAVAIAVVEVILIEPFFELFTFENHNASMAVVGAFVGFFTAGLLLLKTQKYE